MKKFFIFTAAMFLSFGLFAQPGEGKCPHAGKACAKECPAKQQRQHENVQRRGSGKPEVREGQRGERQRPVKQGQREGRQRPTERGVKQADTKTK